MVKKRANVCLELEVVLCVVIADVFDHLVDAIHFADRQFAILDIATYEVAQRAAEVFVARVGEERTRVGQHTYEAAQQAQQ